MYIESILDDLNLRKMKRHPNLSQNRFPLHFRYLFTVILPQAAQTFDNSDQTSW